MDAGTPASFITSRGEPRNFHLAMAGRRAWPAKVLRDRCQRELELGTARSAQAQTAKPQGYASDGQTASQRVFYHEPRQSRVLAGAWKHQSDARDLESSKPQGTM
jgi:hypothetical protein